MTDTKEMRAALRLLYEQERWPELIFFFRAKWNAQAWLFLKKNGNAVKRVKDEFTSLTRCPAYQSATNAKHWDEQIAKYVERLGVPALINDMRTAVAKYKNIRSIIYFLYAKDASRWEMLLMQKIEADLREQKAALKNDEKAAYEALIKLFGAPTIQKIAEPQWVIDARANLTKLYQQRRNERLPIDEKNRLDREIHRINYNLKKFGFSNT